METYENTKKSEFDCDSWAHFDHSFLIAAGVPKERVRTVCGITKSGIGHSTNYVLDDSLDNFRHINSTWSYEQIKGKTTLEDFPKASDAQTTDFIGIKDVWFSFSQNQSWHKFVTSSASNSFKQIGNDLFRIYPVVNA